MTHNSFYYMFLFIYYFCFHAFHFIVKIAGAITFKNYVKRNWKVPEEGQDKIHPSDRNQVKAFIFDLMLTSPLPVQKQLSQAIAIIGKI